jgi:hypothetical protein
MARDKKLNSPRKGKELAMGHLRATTPSLSELGCRPTWWRVFGYLAAVAPLLLLAPTLWMRPDLARQDMPDWRPVLALADAAREKEDLYEARHLYLQVERIATWQQDWEGLVAAACGIKRLDGAPRPYSKTHSILIRAMMAAESNQSRAGIAVVARAFTAIGETKAASMVLARVRPDWPQETRDLANLVAVGCWQADASTRSAGR